MAKQTVPAQSGDLAAERDGAEWNLDRDWNVLHGLVWEAAAEIEAVVDTLAAHREKDTVDFAWLVRGSLKRLRELNSVVLSIHGSDDNRPISEMHEIVFCERMEVSHG